MPHRTSVSFRSSSAPSVPTKRYQPPPKPPVSESGTTSFGEAPEPSPAQGDIRVAVHAVGLNPVDYKIARMGHPDWRFPHILGLDVAGVVDAIGASVSQWQLGDWVFYHGDLSKPGGFAEFAVTTAHTVARIPDGMSFVDAASLPWGLTAYHA